MKLADPRAASSVLDEPVTQHARPIRFVNNAIRSVLCAGMTSSVAQRTNMVALAARKQKREDAQQLRVTQVLTVP